MAKGRPAPLVAICPCCQAELKVDVETGAVLSHKVPERPRPIEDIVAAAAALKGEAAKRDAAFAKSFEAHKAQKSVFDRKFDELLKQAKDAPDTGPIKRDFDL